MRDVRTTFLLLLLGAGLMVTLQIVFPEIRRKRQTTTPPQYCVPLPLTFPQNTSFFPCDWRPTIPPPCTHRLRSKLFCTESSADILYEWVSVDTPPVAYSFTDKCLGHVVRERCTEDKKLIPNLVHSVMFGGKELSVLAFLGILSTVRYVQPCLVLLQADILPTGTYWDTLLRLVPNILHVKRDGPNAVFGRKVKVVQHRSDIARLEAVKMFGGLYADTDYLLLNSVENLRQYEVVMGKTLPFTYCNCIFMGKAGAKFFDLWYDGYRSFKDNVWAFHSTFVPFRLHKIYPKVPFHVVDTFNRPTYDRVKEQFYQQFYNWTTLQGIHLLWRRNWEFFRGDFETRDGSQGQVTRRVMFGSHEACYRSTNLTSEIARMKLSDPEKLIGSLFRISQES